jgi:hypothetical protein
MIWASSVPTEHLDAFDAKFHESLRRIAKEGVDLNRMRMLIDRDERQVFFHYGTVLTFSNSFQVAQQSRV